MCPNDQPRASVIIPAHNEASVIRRCLDALFSGIDPGELDVVVICNGCSDATATVARTAPHPLRVLELETASKAAALRAGDGVARAFPRLYLDADVLLNGASARSVAERLSAGAVAARPPLHYDSGRSSAPVRSYYRARSRIPAVLGSLWGAGIYGLSAAGRARFDNFPDVAADDLWLDRQFAAGEIEIVDCPPVVVTVPRRTVDLYRVLRRTYRGKREMSPDGSGDGRGSCITRSVLEDLRRLMVSGPVAALDASVYAAFAVAARAGLAVSLTLGAPAGCDVWERDDSSRIA